MRPKTTMVGTVLMVALGFAVTDACGQQLRQANQTVSVATLRVPDKAWHYYEKAKSEIEHNRLEEADRDALRAIELAPNFAEAYLLRAGQQVQAHEFDAAVASAEQARRIDRHAMWAGVLLAGAYNGLHRYSDAREVLEELQGSEADSWQAKYERARAAIGEYDAVESMRWSLLALEAAPEGFADVHLVRANAMIQAQRWSEAAAQIEEYMKIAESKPQREDVAAVLADVKLREHEEQLAAVASK